MRWAPIASSFAHPVRRAQYAGKVQTSCSAKVIGKLLVHEVGRSDIALHIAVYLLLGDTAHLEPSGIRHLQGMNLQIAQLFWSQTLARRDLSDGFARLHLRLHLIDRQMQSVCRLLLDGVYRDSRAGT